LSEMHTEIDQDRPGRVVLDTVGHELDAEIADESDDRAEQAAATAVGGVAQEYATEFDDVDDGVAEVTEGRVAGAEVVDRDAYAAVTEVGEVVPDVVVIARQLRLGDFDDEPRRVQACRGDRLPDLRAEPRSGVVVWARR
jgi:phage I-like protein